MDAARDLLDALDDQAATTGFVEGAEQTGRAWGKVTVASPLQVLFAGDTAAVRITQKNASYTPALNDVVALVRFGSKWVAVCKIGAA